MKNLIIIIICMLFLVTHVFSQIQEPGQPESLNLQKLKNIPTLSYSFKKEQIKATNDTIYDIGIAEQVNINFFNAAKKRITNKNIEVYQLKIHVNNSLGVGLNFNKFYIPENCKLYAYNENRSVVLGAFTSLNNQSDEMFSIQPISGETIILEYNKPIDTKELSKINISRIAKIYRPVFGNKNNATQKDSSCYTDVHCVSNIEVDRSVMKWFFYDSNDESYYVCSCALVNQDVNINNIKPYVLTANHCGKNAELSTAVFYFNYQNSNCGNNNASLFNYTMTGGSKKAKRSLFDMFLLELNSFPPPDYNVHLSGWNRSKKNSLTDNMMGIHHPHGDEKNVSLGSLKSNTNPNFWRVEWDINDSPTQNGSSGSPLYEDQNNQIIGWLSYGFAQCDNLDGIESYGKFRKAWTGPSTAKRLRNWLDPHDYDQNQLIGRDPCFTNLIIQNRLFFSAEQRYQPENKVTVQAGNSLTTVGTVVIKNGSEHKFTADNEILFKSGFLAELNSNFLATLEPCEQIAKFITDNNSNNKFSDLNNNFTTFNVYPNPSSGIVTIEYYIIERSIISIELFTVNGMKIKNILNPIKQELGKYQTEINVNRLPKGVYTCVLKTSKTIYNKKLIVN